MANWDRDLSSPDYPPPLNDHRLLPELAGLEVAIYPGLIFDDHKPEDCDRDGEDDCADALRYGLMSRPVPKPIPVANAPSDFDVAAAFKMIENRRKRVGYIGHEHELAVLYRLR